MVGEWGGVRKDCDAEGAKPGENRKSALILG